MSIYKCPICEQGYLEIIMERTGPIGYRETEINIVNNSCGCVKMLGGEVGLAIMSYKDKAQIKHKVCEHCGQSAATIHNPIRAWAGEYQDICTACFKAEQDAFYGNFIKLYGLEEYKRRSKKEDY